MANKELKSIKFPGLEDTYTLPKNLASTTSTELFNGTLTLDGESGASVPVDFVFEDGANYVVTYQGVEYETTGVFRTALQLCVIGNAVMFGFDNTGEPFAAVATQGTLAFAGLDMATGEFVSGDVSVKIEQVDTKIEKKYLPQTSVVLYHDEEKNNPYVYKDKALSTKFSKSEIVDALESGEVIVLAQIYSGYVLSYSYPVKIWVFTEEYAQIAIHSGTQAMASTPIEWYYTSEHTQTA